MIYQLPTAVIQNVKHHAAHNSTQIQHVMLKKHGVNTLSQAINHQDSVQVTAAGSGKTYSLRGFGANAGANSLIIYNGIPLNGISLAGTDLGIINTQNIQSIQILPGSAGTALGNNAVGGVIAVNSKLPNQTQSQISLTQGWPMLSQITASHTQVFNDQNKINVSLSANHSLPQRQHEKNESAQAQLQIQHHSTDNDTQFFIQGGPQKAHYPGSLSQAQVNADRYQGGDYQGRFNSNIWLTHLASTQRFTPHWSGKINLSHQQLCGRGTWENSDSSYLENSQSTRLEPALTWHNNHWSSTLGTLLVRANYFTTGLNDAKQYESDQYLLNKLTLPDGWQLNLGGRTVMANQHDTIARDRNHMRVWLMSVGVNWQIAPAWQWSLRRAGSFRLPMVDENSYTQTNIALKPQTGISYETDLQFKRKGFVEKLELYQLNLNNEIAFAPPINSNRASNINLPRTKRQGLIFDSKNPLGKKWQLDGSFSLMRNHFRASGKDVPWTVPLLASLGVDYQINSQWHYYLQGQYTGKRYASSDFSNIGGAYGQFLTVNTSVLYQLKHWSFGVRVNNLTNRKYYNSVTYSSSQNGFYPAEGINGAFTVSYRS